MESFKHISYRIVDTPFGEIAVVWQRIDRKTKIIHVVLPKPVRMERYIKRIYPSSISESEAAIEMICKKMKKYFAGSSVNFSSDITNLSRLYNFQKRVLLTERKIPYGWVSTYGRLAFKIGRPNAARAVGTALARNPFPIIIPCHRTIRADGTLGGFQGGLNLKRALLELEGVQFNRFGKVIMEHVW